MGNSPHCEIVLIREDLTYPFAMGGVAGEDMMASMGKTAKILGSSLVAVACLLSMAGCGSNAGGATTCGDYLRMSSSNQSKAVEKMLSDHGQSTSNGNITLTKVSVWGYCQTVGSNSSTIDGVFGG